MLTCKLLLVLSVFAKRASFFSTWAGYSCLGKVVLKPTVSYKPTTVSIHVKVVLSKSFPSRWYLEHFLARVHARRRGDHRDVVSETATFCDVAPPETKDPGEKEIGIVMNNFKADVFFETAMFGDVAPPVVSIGTNPAFKA